MGLLTSSRVSAVLGPTNTGKTHFAVNRLLSYSSGIIGFPLRLLARENYDKAVALKGSSHCALVTGEEKIIPPSARYFFCTVESMPLDRPVDCVAVDEIQLCAQARRGHIFTDRLLNLRGTAETIFIGSNTIASLIRKLVRNVTFVEKPRLSTLRYHGSCRLTRLPPRSAVVAFSTHDVYQIAELIRQQHGGAAVVLGALSPRTRNAQVALFENGDVEYLVATDAIGMGLNLDLDHVAFSALRKFDGQYARGLTPAELGQIAGRAGRHHRDGTFGTGSTLGPFPPVLIEQIESHDYEKERAVYWRNSDLDFRSPHALLRSLDQRPAPEMDKIMWRVRDGEDHQALIALTKEQAIVDRAKGKEAVKCLWDICQVPDFCKTLTDQHLRLLSQLYQFLTTGRGRVDTDWINKQIERIDKTDADIDTLIQRIAQIRTWTYISNYTGWLEDADNWQDITRTIEDRLSDALHRRLTQRFVDKRTAKLVRRLRTGGTAVASITAKGDIVADGDFLGRMSGFTLDPGSSESGTDLKTIHKTILSAIPERIALLVQDNDGSFLLDDQGRLTWRGAAIGKIIKGNTPLAPMVELDKSPFLDSEARAAIRPRLQTWLDRHIRAQLKALFALRDEKLDATARGLAWQLGEEFGSLQRRGLQTTLNNLAREARQKIGQLGVRIGREYVFVPSLMRPRPTRLRALLWAAWQGKDVPPLPDFEGAHFTPAHGQTPDFCAAIGYHSIKTGGAVRIDVLERLLHEAFRQLRGDKEKSEEQPKPEQPKSGNNHFTITDTMRTISGLDDAGLTAVFVALRFHSTHSEDGTTLFYRHAKTRQKAIPETKGTAKKNTQQKNRTKEKKPKNINPDSPFAVLQSLNIGKKAHS